jgi:hypothetical protein
VEQPPRQTKVACIGLDDGDRLSEASAKVHGPFGVHLNGDDAHPCVHQRRRYRARAGTDIEDAGAGREVGVSDELLRPSTVELMPSPCPP